MHEHARSSVPAPSAALSRDARKVLVRLCRLAGGGAWVVLTSELLEPDAGVLVALAELQRQGLVECFPVGPTVRLLDAGRAHAEHLQERVAVDG